MLLKEVILSEAKSPNFEELYKRKNAKKIDSKRLIVKNRKGENNAQLDPAFIAANVDIYRIKVHGSEKPWHLKNPVFFLCKKGTRLKGALALFDFTKPNIEVITNTKATVYDEDICDQVFEVLQKESAALGDLFATHKTASFIFDKSLLNIEGASAKEPDAPTDPAKDGIFVIGTWGNPYSKSDESIWMGPFSNKKAASASMKRVMKRGPRTFINWSGEKTAYFTGLEKFLIGAKKIGLNPKIDEDDLYFKDLD